MKTRKAWAIPIAALAFAMLFAYGLIATGTTQAQVIDAAPTVGTAITDQSITIALAAADEDIALAAAFADADDTVLVYTALTSDVDVGNVAFQNAHVATTGPVQVWWDALDGDNTECRPKADALGFSLTFDGDDSGTEPDNAPATTADGTNATGLCREFAALENAGVRTTVRQAFHWDMLTGPEMVTAATVGGLSNPSGYAKRFAALTTAQQGSDGVGKLFADNVLAMGLVGNLILTNVGINNVAPEGKVGEATITVKASDKFGRFLTDAPKQTFKLTTSLTRTGTILPMNAGHITATPGFGYLATYDAGTDGDADDPTRVEVRIDANATTILDIDVNVPTTGFHTNPLNFSLTDGQHLKFRISKRTENPVGTPVFDQAQIIVAPEEVGKLTSDAPYKFTLSVNELGHAPANSEEIEIWVFVVVDNTAPTFAAGTPTTGTVKERANGDAIATFTATDPNNQVLTYSIAAESGDDAAAAVLGGIQIDRATGELTATESVSAKTPGTQPDFVEPEEEDDPATTDIDESMPDNEHVFIITVSDGTLSATHEFTLTVTDEPDPARGADLTFEVPENQRGGVNNPIDTIGLEDATGNYVITEQIAFFESGPVRVDGDESIFGISDDGVLYLKVAGTIDFEDSKISNNYSLVVDADGAESDSVIITVSDVNERPEFTTADLNKRSLRPDTGVTAVALYVLESAAVDSDVSIGTGASASQPSNVPARFAAVDEDSASTGNTIVYSLWYDADTTDDETDRDDPYTGAGAWVKVEADGTIKVRELLDTDAPGAQPRVVLELRAADPTDTDEDQLRDTLLIEVNIIDTNVAPEFDAASKAKTTATLNEDVPVGTVVHTYFATDADGDIVRYQLRDQEDSLLFEIGESDGVLKTKAALDFETRQSHTVEVQAHDTDDDKDEVVLVVTVVDVNDNAPVLTGPRGLQVAENSPRGTALATYSATDADGGPITFSLIGTNAESFQIGETDGVLKTLESLDFDTPNTPCPATGCQIQVVATDDRGKTNTPAHMVTITVVNAPDSISTPRVSKANPVPGQSQGSPMSALADVKTTAANQTKVLERPTDLPATGDGVQVEPFNFVETEWANWGTVLRVEVTAESPDPNCDGGNRCVVIKVEGDSSDDILQLKAYRSSAQENRFVAAVMPVSGEGNMAETVVGKNSTGAENPPIYKHIDGTVARLKVDEEDKIKIEFNNVRASVDVENEVPEIDNFLPAHEAATDDADVDYTFTVTDDISGMPEVEDLPDSDGDDDYISVVALVSRTQCETQAGRGLTAVSNLNLGDGVTIYCSGTPTVREVIDDNDFDDIDGGFEVETTVVLGEGKYFVSFIACDKAGNCSAYDPEQTKEDETLPEITVDTVDPELIEARTGVKWNTTDNEYDDDRTFVQVIFREHTPLNPDTIEADDFVVEGHTIKKVYWYDPDDEDRPWADDNANTNPTRFGRDSKYQTLEHTVFLELEDELAPDETPDVALVPNGIEDKAGNEQDDGEEEADDWIAPNFAIVSIVSPREVPESAVLAGEDDEVVITITVDERIKATRPDVSVNYVNAPSGMVSTTGTEECTMSDGKKGTRARGEIITASGDCLDSGEATGGSLSVKIEKVSNTEWLATVNEPDSTGYYNIYVSATDRSSQQNPGDEGVAPADIVKDFFKGNGDVDSGDANYFEGDIVLNDPSVRVSGVEVIDDSEPTVELKTPLFVEFDFSTAEGAEYAEDSFDFVQVTKFTLDGVDMTDSVKTTDDETFLVALTGISAGEHEIKVQAVDRAGNELDDELEIDFEVDERDPFDKRLDPGWNLVSLPGEPADSSIATVFGSNVDVKTVYTYDPVVPGGWLVAVRETLESDWQGDLTEITAKRGYWVLSDAIQDWEVSIPRLAGGAVDSGTPIQPPVIPMYAGWNLVPVIDVTGDKLDDSDTINAQVYLNSLDDGLDLARVLGFNTITNQWRTLPVGENASDVSANLNIGSAYWVFVRESASLVPGGN